MGILNIIVSIPLSYLARLTNYLTSEVIIKDRPLKFFSDQTTEPKAYDALLNFSSMIVEKFKSLPFEIATICNKFWKEQNEQDSQTLKFIIPAIKAKFFESDEQDPEAASQKENSVSEKVDKDEPIASAPRSKLASILKADGGHIAQSLIKFIYGQYPASKADTAQSLKISKLNDSQNCPALEKVLKNYQAEENSSSALQGEQIHKKIYIFDSLKKAIGRDTDLHLNVCKDYVKIGEILNIDQHLSSSQDSLNFMTTITLSHIQDKYSYIIDKVSNSILPDAVDLAKNRWVLDATFEPGNEDTIIQLLKNGANINSLNSEGFTPKGIIEKFCPCFEARFDELVEQYGSAQPLHNDL